MTSSPQAREVQWLLGSLQDSLASLKEGLEECVAILAPKEPGSTLVLSSLRSESVKGFVTRIGTKIVKGVRLSPLLEYPFPESSFLARRIIIRNDVSSCSVSHASVPQLLQSRRPPESDRLMLTFQYRISTSAYHPSHPTFPEARPLTPQATTH